MFRPSSANAPAVIPASFTNPPCREFARQRAADAAVNGFEAAIQLRTAQDTYQDCVRLQQTGVARPPAP